MDKKLQAYYTNSDFITDYMINNLDLENKDTILEPSVGGCIFVDKILSANKNVYIDAYDIDDYAIRVVKQKYSNKENIKIYESDTLFDERLDLLSDTHTGYTKIIGNPPYGAYLNMDVRKNLQIKYSGIYTKDTYVLFFYRCLNLLKPNGKMVFIIPDTFLYLNMHKNFRKYLFGNFCVEEIAIFPSKLFPGVSFAYSNLSIITVRNDKTKILGNNICVYDDITNETQFNEIIENRMKPKFIAQKSILDNPNYNLYLNKSTENLIRQTKITLGDLADCVTGIYTGNNKGFIKVLDERIRNSKGYQVISNEEINLNWKSVEGIETSRCYVPLVKGSIKTPYRNIKDEWFINWSKEAIWHYNNDKRARFQNSSYYFRTGIAVPMLKSKKVKAAIINGKVFDQSIVGVFPKDNSNIYFLLALLNSNIVNKIIHNINPTVNNSANYLKRIPIPNYSRNEFNKISELAYNLVHYKEENNDILDFMINELYFRK